ncbi:daunorubicin resistance protein DrrA family ABC transporter ATP-binding protein [Planotetraspora phitsanulokensis]|uniref:Daunorubicin resistance protein DrrA family ABC transporter ATP-binding protein n=1 Tax=Planotetraspora phitsanulokensis TaxID=575192 RepID=A0A8J3U9I2_9ACTN|nr:ATP-binding cassette domain-containing protein [Planotetraspora phitsanulokensis]GII38489.1 daunorubicin resistance protein DrrA family ABC transporter ATP-binding protein [Planotetraspora phitsanulokensis]
MSNTIEAEGLVKRYGDKTALDGVDLEARAGSVLGVLGPNGAGKTTAVRILATLVSPDGGSARVGGHDVTKEPAKVRELIGLTGQYASVDEKLTGRQNLVMIGRLLGMDRTAARARAADLLGRFGLGDAADRAAQTYSGGMRRRLDLAVSLVGEPSIIFMDEPTTGLDPQVRAELWAVLREQIARGATVLLTTQYLEEADQLADEIVLIDRGKVSARGTPDELKARAGDRRLEIRPEHDAEKAGRILAEVTGLRPHHGENGVISVPVLDPALPPAALRRLDDAGIVLTEHALRRPTLDEAFLALVAAPADGSPERPAGRPVERPSA